MKLLKLKFEMEMTLAQLLTTDEQVAQVTNFSEADKAELLAKSQADMQTQLGSVGTITCKTLEISVVDV